MKNYDFRVLEPSEFEIFSRDILQAREDIFIESFAEGRDGGIDLRFAFSKTREAIVQCKRYKDWTELKSILKKEIDKVNELKPKRYIITTSVDLSPDNKKTIKKLFAPYILSNKDILGKKDLNNLLGKHPAVEKQHYKLWLASTDVMENILHRDMVFWSKAERRKAAEYIRHYVMNPSFDEAKDLIDKYHFVIISGIPGIGKTTLARALAYDLIAHGYEDLICISRELKEMASMIQEGKKQVFFFDDFLGSTEFIDNEKNFDSNLTKLIDEVRLSSDKILIMTTREYILNDALKIYEKLDSKTLNLAKFIINLETYSLVIKASILYNHLIQVEDMPLVYLEELIKNKNYRKITNHQGYNPRIIDAYLKQFDANTCTPKEFVDGFIKSFDHPFSVWDKAFTNMNTNTKYALLVFATMGNAVNITDWEEAYKSFCKSSNESLRLTYDGQIWRDCLKTLDNCFVCTKKHGKQIIVEFYNPSIKDYVLSYLKQYPDMIENLLKGAIYVDQLLSIYRDNDGYERSYQTTIPIYDLGIASKLIVSRLCDLYRLGLTCGQTKSWLDEYSHDSFLPVRVLTSFANRFPRSVNENIGVLESLVEEKMLLDDDIDISSRIDLVNVLDTTLLSFNIDEVVESWAQEDMSLDDITSYVSLCNGFDLDVCDSKKNYSKIDDEIEHSINNITSDSDGDDIKHSVDKLGQSLKCWSPDIDIDEEIGIKLSELEERNYWESTGSQKKSSSLEDFNLQMKRVDEIMTSLLDVKSNGK